MVERKRNQSLVLFVVSAFLWIFYCAAFIAFQVAYLSFDHTIDAEWWLYCIGMGITVSCSAICIAIVRKYTRGHMIAHLAAGIVGTIPMSAWFGALAGSLSQQGFLWIYLPIGAIPGAVQGLVTHIAVNRSSNS